MGRFYDRIHMVVVASEGWEKMMNLEEHKVEWLEAGRKRTIRRIQVLLAAVLFCLPISIIGYVFLKYIYSVNDIFIMIILTAIFLVSYLLIRAIDRAGL